MRHVAMLAGVMHLLAQTNVEHPEGLAGPQVGTPPPVG